MPKHLPKYRDLIQAYFRKLGAQASSSALTRHGEVHARDLIALRCPSGDVAVVWCLMCCGCDDEVALVVSQLAPERAPDIGRRHLAKLVWCQHIPWRHLLASLRRMIMSTSAPP